MRWSIYDLDESETHSPRKHRAAIACVAGVLLGAAAGLIGVGGGEFRIPVLLYVLRLGVKNAAAVNLLVGLFTVVLAFARRWQMYPWSLEEVMFGAVLAAASLCGSLFGALMAHRVPDRPLRRVVIGYLLVVGIWMIYEAQWHLEIVLVTLEGACRYVLAAGVAAIIGFLSSALGVAGGEMRIPVLMYVFGYDVKMAGTLSLLASIPTVGAGAATYRRLGHMPNWALTLAVIMGTGSLVGVLIGTSLLPYTDRRLLKTLLGTILLLASLFLAFPELRHRSPAPPARQ
ncbi:MAG: hypothetical protein C4297_11690 [Gemmataceae bacterium]